MRMATMVAVSPSLHASLSSLVTVNLIMGQGRTSSSDPAGQGRVQEYHMHIQRSVWLLIVLAGLPLASSADDRNRETPAARSPEASLAAMRVRPGFRVELMASEPLVLDPIAFEWGADAKLWVVEMGDYPLGIDGKGKPGGVVRVLEDSNGDGRYDKSTTFLDGLPFPTAVVPWRKGVIVGCAPDIFYAEDTNGDGKADVRRVLFTGFTEGNQQHRINGFDFGLDGWVYGANGDSGGTVRSLAAGKTVPIGGRDFRFRPDTGEFETASGQTQYGRHRDDWGNWFGDSNPVWAWHYVLAESDMRRNPHFAPPDPRKILEPETRLYPVSRTLPRFNDPDQANRATSANSPTPYRDELFGQSFESSVFVSEPVHNLVHRLVLEPDGPSFRGRRADDEADREFLASSDNWFRPTMLRTGPDGALWIADMYRAVIEHPEWIPDDWEAKLDLRAGADQGRIYRVVPKDGRPRPIPRLDRLDMAGLVAALDSPNGWTRDTAARLLVERGDRAAIEALRALAARSTRAKTKVQVLWTLQLLGGLDARTMTRALGDAHPEVRRNAIRAGAGLLADPGIGEAVLRLAADPDARVRLQVALSLGDWDDPRGGRALATLARQADDDPWLRSAILSSSVPHAATLLADLFADPGPSGASTPILESLMATAAAQPGPRGLAGLFEVIARPRGRDGAFSTGQFAALAGLLDALGRSRGGATGDTLERVAPLLAAARQVVDDPGAPEEARLSAARLLGRDPAAADADLKRLRALLGPHVAARLQAAAVAALARTADPRVPEILLADWKAQAPAQRIAIIDTLASRDAWAAALVAALERRDVRPAEIGPAVRRRLLGHRDRALRGRAELVFAGAASGRRDVLERYHAALAVSGDPTAGAGVFRKLCVACHRFAGEGIELGPDLAALTDKSSESLLIAILDPNRAFEAKYAEFLVQTTDGRVLGGLIAAESSNSVTLRRQDGKEDVLLRGEIEAVASTGQSVMPEGLEKDLSPRDVADVIAYLGTSGPPRKVFAGNDPQIVQSDKDGAIRLRAAAAEIYGDTLVFEPTYGNLGYWSALNDRATWRFEVTRPGKYEVWLDYACADASQGNGFVIDVAGNQLAAEAPGTGTWDEYRRLKVGEADLPQGKQRLEVRPAKRIRGALMDLRAIELKPR
jgi:putative membrane-bound dehydrogenase-like protein